MRREIDSREYVIQLCHLGSFVVVSGVATDSEGVGCYINSSENTHGS